MREKKLKRVKSCIIREVIPAFTLGIILLFSCETDAKIIEKIVAIVNGDIITLSELREISVPYLEKMQLKFSLESDEEQIKEVEKRILDQLIDEKLVKQEADRLEIVVDDKEVDLAVRDVMSKNNIAKEQFEQVLLEEGLTFEDYRKQLKDQMQKMRLLDLEIKSKIQITEKEVEKYYKENIGEYNAPPEVRIQQILLIIPSKASEQEINQIREKANGILQKIREGEDFTSMVKLYSQDANAAIGGVMGAFRQGELLPALNKVAFSLEVNEVSSVIQTSRGFHIIRVLDKRERQKMTKEEKWNEIENFLYNQKFEDEFKQWVKKIRKRSYVKISL
ncbi:MAG: peptidylprolyl isomerase [Deltaproteobacteria bacterium]|nr:peptidylprolyl isomerase [Deltaproteobacteria bacterium]